MNQPGDDELRRRFDALRASDERRAPAFRAVLDRERLPAVTRSRWRPRVVIALAAAAAAVLVSVDIVRRANARAAAVPPLSTWTSPTAGLLSTSGSELLASPTLMRSILDGVASTRIHYQGN